MSTLTFEPELVGLAIGDAPERWQAIGVDVRYGLLDIGGVRLRFAGTDGGIRSWVLRSQDNTGRSTVCRRPCRLPYGRRRL